MAGRLITTSADLNDITLDSAPALSLSNTTTIEIIQTDGTLINRTITAVNGNVVRLAAPLSAEPLPNAIFMITEPDVQPELWRVVSISEVETNQIEIGAISHNPGKYDLIEEGLALVAPQIGNLTTIPSAPNSVTALVSRYVIDIGVAGLRLTLSWSGSANRFNVAYRRENGQVVSLVQNQNSIDIDNVDIGAIYSFSVTAISTLGFTSQPAKLDVTVAAPAMVYPDDVTGLTASVASTGVQLAWNDIASPMLYDYEIREGTNWDSARSLGYFAGSQASVPPLPSSNYQWMIKARDKLLNESVNADFANLGITAPSQPAITAGISGQNYVLSWNTPASMFPIDHYIISTGSVIASASQIALAYTTLYQSKIDFGGAKSFWVAAVDTAGNIGPYGLAQITITTPAQPAITTQIIDNNVLLYWSDATKSLPIITYQLSKGVTFATAEIIGTKSGLFTTVFETAAGTYTYWIAGIDAAGNIGTPGSITATVNAPPDYVLHSDQFSIFNGTLSNARLDQGNVVMPIDTASTWAQHFLQNSWNSPADQIAAGFPVYAEPTEQSGYYEEVIDYGATLAATNVTITPTIAILAGAPVYSVTISASNTSPTGPWADYPATLQVYLTNFRWLKIRLAVTSPDNKSLLALTSLETKLDVKLKSDAGMVLVNAADSAGTPVRFNVAFSDVASITLTPQGSVPLTAIYNFSGAANPTQFQVMLFTPSGQRTSGTISWAAKGY